MESFFVCVGAAKSGTTSLHDILRQNQQIYIPEEKDFHFFDDDTNYQKGKDWYLKFFSGKKNEKVYGEIAATYLYNKLAPQRIFDFAGKDCKILFILRNPAKRSYSEYLHHFRMGSTTDTYDNYLNKKYNPKKYSKDPYFLFVERSQYSKFIPNFLEYFPREQMYFVIMEELFSDAENVLGNLNKFLGVEDFKYDLSVKSNEGFIPKSVTFNKIIFGKSPIKKVLKHLLPSYKLRSKFKLWMSGFNKSKKENTTLKLTNERYQQLNDTYFRDDILFVEELMGRVIESWK